MPGAEASRASSRDPASCSTASSSACSAPSPASTASPTAFLEQTTDDDTTTYGEFIRDGGFPESFVRLYAVPLVACVWSSGGEDALDYPARYLFRFLEHHGMLTVGDSPQWMTVVGGSRTYVDALAERLPAVRSGDPVTSVLRGPEGVEVRTRSGRTDTYDRIVLALHADDALGILADPTPAEKEVLGALPVLPQRDRAPSRRGADAAGPPRPLVVELPRRRRPSQGAIVTYWMNRLQGLPRDEPFYVTLNATDRIDPAERRRDDAVPAPALRPRRPCAPSAGCPSSRPSARPSPGRTTGGASTRTAAARAWRPPPPSG